MQKINFRRNVDQFIIEELKETILYFSQRTVGVL